MTDLCVSFSSAGY